VDESARCLYALAVSGFCDLNSWNADRCDEA